MLTASLCARVAAAALPSRSGDQKSAVDYGGPFLLPVFTPAGGYHTFLLFIKLINLISSGFLYAFFSVGKCHSLALLVDNDTD